MKLKISLAALLLVLTVIQGCSSNYFRTSAPKPELRISPGYISLPNISSSKVDDLVKHCKSLSRPADIPTALRLRCAMELLSREQLSKKYYEYGKQLYNDALEALLRLTPNQYSHIKIIIEDKRDFVFARDLHALDQDLQPEIFGEIGVPVITSTPNDGSLRDPNYPREGIFKCITYVVDSIELDGLVLQVNIKKLENKKYKLGTNTYSLASSPGAAYLSLLNAADIDDYSFLGFTDAIKAEDRRGIFGIGELSNSKIPLIMIHGLNSDPLIWKHLTMRILNNEILFQKYQVWHVYYPSGPPPFYNAMMVRNELKSLLKRLNKPILTKKAVFIGHSLGGIITKTLVSDVNYELWDATFINRPEKVLMSENSELADIFIFKPVFTTNTAFFLDTPHRGSSVANSFIGSIGSSIVSLPSTFTNIFKNFLDRVGLSVLTTKMLPFLESNGPNSVQVLRPGHPMMDALVNIPIQGHAYSIIGSNTKSYCDLKSLENCSGVSDGVVDFNSAYLKDIDETIVVDSSHNSFKNPDAIDFIIKRL